MYIYIYFFLFWLYIYICIYNIFICIKSFLVIDSPSFASRVLPGSCPAHVCLHVPNPTQECWKAGNCEAIEYVYCISMYIIHSIYSLYSIYYIYSRYSLYSYYIYIDICPVPIPFPKIIRSRSSYLKKSPWTQVTVGSTSNFTDGLKGVKNATMRYSYP